MKKVFRLFLVAMFILTAGYNMSNSYKDEVALSDLMLENVEALARTELSLECDSYSVVIKCEKMCFSCYRIWKAVGGYGNPGNFSGTCTCGRTY